jgi:hypothetical protein
MKIPQPMENPVNAMRILLPFMAAKTSISSSLKSLLCNPVAKIQIIIEITSFPVQKLK